MEREAGRVEAVDSLLRTRRSNPPPKEREKEEGKEELAAPRPSVLVDAIVIWQPAGCMWRQ